ncbi:MAG: zinc ABC transporter substrate-binding protein [Lachnospiraceae bacterium]|nr:zinc ABC transporter substrate-binding protein [Lachnospiraceae bacterium]
MRKKTLGAIGMALIFAMTGVTGCGNGENKNIGISETKLNNTEASATEEAAESNVNKATQGTEKNADKYQIVCTTFPQYDWVRNILGDDNQTFELNLLLKNGGDLHNYQPTAEDMILISDCDLFITVGGESDGWVEEATKTSTNDNQKVVKLMDLVREDILEHDHEEDDDHDHDEEHELYDEHIWLSLDEAQDIVDDLTDIIATMDKNSAREYEKNSEVYEEKLERLDEQYENVAQRATKKALIFGDRFPFRYMVEDYHIPYYAAFDGCSAETEASFETIAFLSGKIDELQLQSVLVMENSDKSVAKAIIENTKDKNQSILVMDSLQSVTMEDIEQGRTYLKAMEENLEVLKQALQ